MNKYLEQLNRKLQNNEVFALELYAKEHNVPIIEFDSLMILKMLIKTKNIKNILEIGCAIGYSSINMALFDEEIKIDTIERNEKMYEIALQNVSQFKLEKQIQIHFADALELDLKKLKKEYDLIFIDASKAQSEKFFKRFDSLLTDDGIIVTDNLLFHGCVENSEGQSKNVKNMVKKIDAYNHFLVDNQDFETIFIDTGDGLSITKRRK